MTSAALVAVAAHPAAAQTQKTFDIPAESASQAVPAFVQQSGLQVLATSADLQGIQTNAIHGNLSVDAALGALIDHTGLAIKTRDADSAVLVRASAAVASQDAQAPAAAAPAATDSPAQEVVVVGVRKSLRDALEVKRAQTGIMEAISSKDIGALPDVTIAEELDRLPGVTASRDRGNDSQASIRGLGARMVLGTVNGREVASSEPDRNVRWEIYPSEVISGVSVYKSSEARLISGGISGTVDIQTIHPLDYKGPEWVARAGPVYYNGGTAFPGYDGMGYRGAVSFVKRLTPDLGVVIGITSQKQKNGYESVQGWGYNSGSDNGPVLASQPTTKYNTPWGAQSEGDRLTETRFGVSAGVQYRPSQAFQLSYDVLYSDIKINEDQDQAWYGNNVWGNWDGGNYQNYKDGAAQSGAQPTIVNGDVVAASTTWAPDNSVVAKYTEDKKLLVTGLNGKWTEGLWTFTADASYSKAQRYNLWKADEFQYWPALMSYDFTGRPVITVSAQPQNSTQTPNSGQWASGAVIDTLSALHLDARRDLSGGLFNSLLFGARYSDRDKDLGSGSATIAATGAFNSSLVSAYNFKHFKVPSLLTGNFDALAAALYPSGSFNVDPKSTPISDRVKEHVWEAYAEGTYASQVGGVPVDGNVGVRVLDVKTQSNGTSTVAGAWVETPPGSGHWVQQMTTTPVTGGVRYTKVLPSATARFDFGDGRYFKLSAAEVVSRPPLNDMIITRQISSTAPYTGSSGNPYLKPFEAAQVDASYEWYYGKDALAAISTYYKDVHNYVGYSTRQQTINGNVYTLTSPVNANKAGYIDGVELTWQTPFTFIPGGDHFGIYSNYAYVQSNLKEMAANLSLNGLARNTATMDLWYSDHGVDLRLGTKYHSTYTAIYGWNDTQLIRVKPEATVDFSASYNINKAWQVRLQANNLLNTPLRTYDDNQPTRLGRYDLYGQRVLLDVTFRQ
jgi:TonB-dependent receptor